MYHKNSWNNSGDAEDLDLVMSMYNLIEYSSNFSEAKGSLRFYSKDEATNLMQILKTLMILNLSSIRLNYSEILKLIMQLEF